MPAAQSAPVATVSRRGFLYVAVLSTSLVVLVIGMSALLATRVEHRTMVGAQYAVAADLLARSYVDVVTYRLCSNTNWRSDYTSDDWSAGEVADDATLAFMLSDERDGDLANNSTDPVRLYGAAHVGDALRIYSVLLYDPRTETNRLVNPGFEQGTTGWSEFYCGFSSVSSVPHSGTYNLSVYNRTAWYSGPQQVVVDAVESGRTYRASAWVRSDAGAQQMMILLRITHSGGTIDNYYGSAAWADGNWSFLTQLFTPTWSGPVENARLLFCTYSNTGNFSLDDAAFIPVDDRPPLTPVPGTWRREVQP